MNLYRLSVFFLIILVFLTIQSASAQQSAEKTYPANYFRSPLGIPIQLAGNFGELRSNHFHMGLDMRTNQRENLPVYAAAEGYISRIVIEKNGYGRAIVIAHPNGYSTLYAHLNDFYKELNDYVKEMQYKEEKWEQDLNLPEGLFKVSKGQFIAFSGNTGGSQGPHLHFEVRETESENNVNPLHFNFNIPDNVPPLLYGLYMVDRGSSTYNTAPVQVRLKRSAGFFESVDPVVFSPYSNFSFGISAEDKTNNSFKFGVYEAELWIDDSLVNGFRMDDFSYDSSRYINGSIDYKSRQTNGRYIQYLFPLPGNKIPIYFNHTSDFPYLGDSAVHNVEIRIKDVKGNTTTVKLKIRSGTNTTYRQPVPDSSLLMVPSKENILTRDNIEVRFNATALYDTIWFNYGTQESKIPNAVSKIHLLHNFTVPVQDSFTVRIKPAGVPEALRDKVIMQLVSNKKRAALKGTWHEGWLEAKFWDLGMVQLIVDTVPANVRAVGFKNGSNLKNAKSITFYAKDAAGPIAAFRAELDGKWLMFSRKDDYFIHKFDEQTAAGPHSLSVSVKDEAGNITEKVINFVR